MDMVSAWTAQMQCTTCTNPAHLLHSRWAGLVQVSQVNAQTNGWMAQTGGDDMNRWGVRIGHKWVGNDGKCDKQVKWKGTYLIFIVFVE